MFCLKGMTSGPHLEHRGQLLSTLPEDLDPREAEPDGEPLNTPVGKDTRLFHIRWLELATGPHVSLWCQYLVAAVSPNTDT